jgi:hypothetical protein
MADPFGQIHPDVGLVGLDAVEGGIATETGWSVARRHCARQARLPPRRRQQTLVGGLPSLEQPLGEVRLNETVRAR